MTPYLSPTQYQGRPLGYAGGAPSAAGMPTTYRPLSAGRSRISQPLPNGLPGGMRFGKGVVNKMPHGGYQPQTEEVGLKGDPQWGEYQSWINNVYNKIPIQNRPYMNFAMWKKRAINGQPRMGFPQHPNPGFVQAPYINRVPY